MTTDPDEAQQWLREGHHVRVLTERQTEPCTHERRWVYKHYTYGSAWACLACGEHGESWWD